MGTIEKISTFDFGGCKVRTAGTAEQPLFSVADVCAVLGISNPAQACERLKAEEQFSIKQRIGIKPATFVSETGLYKLILRSNKPKAEPGKNAA